MVDYLLEENHPVSAIARFYYELTPEEIEYHRRHMWGAPGVTIHRGSTVGEMVS